MEIIIVGAGKLGYKLAEAFAIEDNNVVMVDIKSSALDRADSQLDVLTVKGNGAQLSLLSSLKAGSKDLLVAVTSSDEANILIASTAKRLGCKKVAARVRNPEYSNQIDFVKKEMNIDYIANPEQETAKEISKYLIKGKALHMEDFAEGRVVMTEFRAKNLPLAKNTVLKDLDLPSQMLIAAIQRDGGIIIPHGDTIIKESDLVYIIGEKKTVNNYCIECGKPSIKRGAKKVMILGGGKAGYYLAKNLIKSGVQVKIVERSEERCRYLAEELPAALIIHGDGTDNHLLREENIGETDALVSLTGYDEENLLVALLAKKHGVEKVIAKVSRPNYVPIIEQLGIDVAINPVLIIASEILRYTQGGRVAALSLLLGGEAEVIEIITQENSSIVGKPLKALNLPKGLIVGAVVKNGDVIIPDGNTVIGPDQRLIIFILQSEVKILKKLFYKTRGGIFGELWDNYKGLRDPSSI